ncbi:hypothetical protein MUB24_16505 [Lederbergia sp. NSJ-179]|uniref:hypothetical protein n=1 Tax=Lederbergia sp. NSJ-179 TaxID=2931402 RepID=UPI001FD3F994|nr:hypothetical protein [Lederbergia sp. NSJ-179]MCJ7842471.1 hypothetical protein [Lederbergia sp. NSJ-179]
MKGLIANELMKIFNRKLTWVLLSLLITITIGAFIANKMNDNPPTDWKSETTQLVHHVV